MEKEIKEIQDNINALIKLIENIEFGTDTISENLIMAKEWLNEVLNMINRERFVSLYEPKEGSYHETVVFWLQRNDLDYTVKLDFILVEVDKIINKLPSIKTLDDYIKDRTISEIYFVANTVYTKLMEAKFWLKFEIQKHKDNYMYPVTPDQAYKKEENE